MKNNKTFLILTFVFIVLLGGASILYKNLTKEIKPQGSGLSADKYNEMVENNSQQNEIDENTSDASETQSEEADKMMAPDFIMEDKDGHTVHLSDFVGKPVVLNFWASWCGPCKMEMPDFDEKYKELGEEIHFLMVNMTDGSRETVDDAKAFIESQGYTFPIYFDTEMDAAITYGVSSIPTTYFINADGYAIAQAKGAIDAATLQTGIDMITKK